MPRTSVTLMGTSPESLGPAQKSQLSTVSKQSLLFCTDHYSCNIKGKMLGVELGKQ